MRFFIIIIMLVDFSIILTIFLTPWLNSNVKIYFTLLYRVLQSFALLFLNDGMNFLFVLIFTKYSAESVIVGAFTFQIYLITFYSHYRSAHSTQIFERFMNIELTNCFFGWISESNKKLEAFTWIIAKIRFGF